MGLFYFKLCQLNSLILSLQARDIVSYSCPSGWKLYENTCIRKYNNFKSYDDAIDKCHTYSAQLVSIKTVGKENAVTSILRWWSDYWIGLFNPINDNNRDHYQWIADNTQLLNLNYSNWYATEPNHEGPCIVLSNKNGRWKWYDRRCNRAYRYICQKDAVATTTQIYISSTFLTSSAQSSSDLVEINPTTSSKFTDYPIGTSSIELSSDHRTMAITSTFNSYTIISTGNEEQAITKLITTESYIPALTLGPNLDISITATPALSASTTSEVITSDTEAVFLSMIQSSDKMTTNSLISNSMIGSNHEMSSGNNLHYSISTVPSNQLQVLTEKPVTTTALNQDQVSSMVNSVEALSSLNLFISSADMDRSVTMQINLEEHSSINQFSPILITALSSLTIPTNFIINPSKEMTSSSTIISMCPSVTPFENISIQCIPTTTAPSTRITLSQTVATTPTIIPQGTVRISIASSPETEVATGKITTTTTIVTTPIPSSKNFISTSDSINRTTSTASFKQPLITTEQPTQIPSTQTVKVTQKTPKMMQMIYLMLPIISVNAFEGGTLATRPEIKATPRQPSNTPSLKPESPTSSTFKATSSMPKATTPPQYTTVNTIQTEISTTAFTSTTEIVDAGKVQSVDNASGILTKLQSAFQTDNNVNSGDLIATKNALSALSKSVNLNNASSDEKTIYFQKYFTVIGSLTSKDKASVWKSANKNFSPTSVILKLTDDMAKKVANNLLEGQIFTTKTPEMTIQVEKVSSNQFRRSGYKIASQGYQFSLPATAIGNNNNANAPVIAISKFSALQYITNEEKTPTTSQGAIDSDGYINSMVIGCSMDPPAQLNHSQPFTYTLPYQQTNYSSNYKPSCVFWDFQNG
ncbi:uncharacterized protein TRIADDRAFT_58103 [Trichoplax adhaerens]|uniref:Uncharacterized protein n=1 Tax=Trichoplax adhaerens TaxID=10228 RepID=B3S2P8_TRIAD|nr:hypothetical protein TRIADDRAFT_58103 [Trichoplax adhaerens]EDV23458.1 hypothetical protein TRIADDRAFT_58103 [Trichoplax adhaerens]|eukprot:XP_002114368.1 hypothetical protein TRIADDRAFT_58103 [Trichoplax adhaerens]